MPQLPVTILVGVFLALGSIGGLQWVFLENTDKREWVTAPDEIFDPVRGDFFRYEGEAMVIEMRFPFERINYWDKRWGKVEKARSFVRIRSWGFQAAKIQLLTYELKSEGNSITTKGLISLPTGKANEHGGQEYEWRPWQQDIQEVPKEKGESDLDWNYSSQINFEDVDLGGSFQRNFTLRVRARIQTERGKEEVFEKNFALVKRAETHSLLDRFSWGRR